MNVLTADAAGSRAVIGLVLLVVVGDQPGALAFFPIIFILAGRFEPRRL